MYDSLLVVPIALAAITALLYLLTVIDPQTQEAKRSTATRRTTPPR